jgi:hypothetical protein
MRVPQVAGVELYHAPAVYQHGGARPPPAIVQRSAVSTGETRLMLTVFNGDGGSYLADGLSTNRNGKPMAPPMRWRVGPGRRAQNDPDQPGHPAHNRPLRKQTPRQCRGSASHVLGQNDSVAPVIRKIAPRGVQHIDANQPIARCSDIAVRGGQVVATIEFPPAGRNDRSDEYLRMLKAGFLSAVSVGFLPLEWQTIQGAGYRANFVENTGAECRLCTGEPFRLGDLAQFQSWQPGRRSCPTVAHRCPHIGQSPTGRTIRRPRRCHPRGGLPDCAPPGRRSAATSRGPPPPGSRGPGRNGRAAMAGPQR